MTTLQEATHDELIAELARRLGTCAPGPRSRPARGGTRAGADSKGSPDFKKRSVWAQGRVDELKARLSEVSAEHAPGGVGLRKKEDVEAALREEISKFERIAAAARRRGD